MDRANLLSLEERTRIQPPVLEQAMAKSYAVLAHLALQLGEVEPVRNDPGYAMVVRNLKAQ